MVMIHIGHGNVVNVSRLVAISVPLSKSIKRTIASAKEEGKCIDMTAGRETKAIVLMDDGHVILAGITPETIMARVANRAKSHVD